MSANDIIMSAAGAGTPEYVDDVFSTWLYTGNGSSQTITNGIDLAGKGGMVWIKGRSAAEDNLLKDTARGAGFVLYSNNNFAQDTPNVGVSNFNNNGFGLFSSFVGNDSGNTYSSWTFRKAPKFFDVVTYTATSTVGTVNHNLGSIPGMIIRKRTDSFSDWVVWHRSLSSGNLVYLNSATTPNPSSEINTVTSTSFDFNGVTGNYVFYVFAHNAGGFGDAGTDNIISCGSYTGSNQTINLGFEPQFILIKRVDNNGEWLMFDTMRNTTANQVASVGSVSFLQANASATEITESGDTRRVVAITSTGFYVSNDASVSGGTYIYMAIRRPMKVPTIGTQVFSPDVLITGAVTGRSGLATGADMAFSTTRNGTTLARITDRLRGIGTVGTTNTTNVLDIKSIAAETSISPPSAENINGWVNNSFYLKNNLINFSIRDTTTATWYSFKRARGFFDVVCYTGTGVARTVNHNLGVAPELMIVKSRSRSDGAWCVYLQLLGNGKRLFLNETLGVNASNDAGYWNNTSPTSSLFTVGTYFDLNASGSTYVAYLFASVNGVSKVGSYTGNGSSQTINCGFSAGARFVLIKRTDSTGDWYVFDTAAGIVAANDRYTVLNTTAAEVTTNDSIDPDSSGFIVNQVAASNINVNTATYIYLAIA